MAITNYWSTAPSLTTTTTIRPGELPATKPAPDTLNLTKFMNWSLQDQIAYIEAKGTGVTPKSVNIGPTGSAIAVSYTSPAGPLVFPTPSQLPAPENVGPNDFAVWTRESQVAYIESKGTGTPKAVYLGAVAPNGTKAEIVPNGAVQLRVASATGEAFTVRNPGRAALASETALAPTALDANVFLSWTEKDRQAYVAAKVTGTPPAVTIGSGSLKIYASQASNVSLGAGVIQRTSGDYEPIPYFELSGSASGTPSSVISTSAEWLFPSLDGVSSKLPVEERPAKFYVDVTTANDADKAAFLKDFAKWHSAYQLEYLKTHGTNVTVGSQTVKKLDIVVGTPAARLTAIVSPDDPTKFFIVQSLDKAAIARMTLAEQQAIVATGSAFTDIAASLGLSTPTADNMSAAANKTNGGSLSGSPTAPFTVSEYVDELIYDVYHTTAGNRGGSTLPTAATDAFNTQLEILKEQIGNSAIVSQADIKKKVDELRDRFNRLFAFYNVKEETGIGKAMGNPDTTITVYTNVISLQGDLSGINRGYSVFLAQEQRIAELAEGRMQLVRDGGLFNGKSLDVPYLVYKFQSLYNLSLEAEVVAETEQVNQQNDMLKTYAAIQDIVNRTLSAFPKADDTKKGVLGKTVDETPSLTTDEMKLLSMFESNLGTSGGRQRHPMEVLNSINRPMQDFFNSDTGNNENFDLNQFTHTQWSTFGTRLSETVTLINQNSQIQMNDINSLDKERNRHFELANNALAKMADIIANISRAGG